VPVNGEATIGASDDARYESASITGEYTVPTTIDSEFLDDDMLSHLSEEQRLLWQRQGSGPGPIALDINMSLDMGCAETILFDWPLEDQELMFGFSELNEN
jgi:hypothetical protein